MCASLTLCHPAESPPARPFARPKRTPDPDRFHCGRAEVHSHQAMKRDKEIILIQIYFDDDSFVLSHIRKCSVESL